MIQCHCVVPLSQSATLPLQTFEENGSLNISEDVLKSFRKYLHVLKYSDYGIPEAISEVSIQSRAGQLLEQSI